jgi:hypothetical protein
MALKRTSDVCGPGAYTLRNPAELSAKPSYTGFSNSARRTATEGVDPRASRLPGPGQYLGLTPEALSTSLAGPVVSSSFTSSAARLAPAYPGSSAFMASSIAANPGPGRYDGRSSVQAAVDNGARKLRVDQGKVQQQAVNDVLGQVKQPYNPPAIPGKLQTFGYTDMQTDFSGVGGDGRKEVRPVGLPPQMHLGDRPENSVGPGQYDQPVLTSKDPRLPSSFSASNTTRDLFHMEHNPGPGDYKPGGTDWNKGGGAAAFRSGTKMAHQVRGERSEHGSEASTGAKRAQKGIRLLSCGRSGQNSRIGLSGGPPGARAKRAQRRC